MELYRCAECALRQSYITPSVRMAGLRTSNTAYRSVQPRFFSSTTAYLADKSETPPTAKDDNKDDAFNFVKLFEQSMARPARKSSIIPARQRTGRTGYAPSSFDTTSTTNTKNSLSNLVDSFGPVDGTRTPISDMVDPMGRFSPRQALKLEPAPFNLGPRLGRTVAVDGRRVKDAGTAFRQLAMLVSRNKVPADARYQKFHERPGLKRKRLKSARWRLKFKAAFQEKVARVQAMKKMGW